MADWDFIIKRETYFIVLALILAFGILQTSGTVLDTEKPVVSVVSCSMYPEYDRGDVLIVKGIDFEEITEGEVIVYDVPLKASVTINGEKFNLSEKKSETPLGAGKVVSVEDSNAILEFDGQKIRVIEDSTRTVDNMDIDVREISGIDIPVVHRVIKKEERSLETRGDNNPRQLEFEKDIQPEQIHGRVLLRIPKVGAIKLIGMDLAGLTGQPLVIDSYAQCR